MSTDNKIVDVNAAIEAVRKIKNCQDEIQVISDTLTKTYETYEQMPNIGALAACVCPTIKEMNKLLPDFQESLAALGAVLNQALEGIADQQTIAGQMMGK